MTQWINRLDGRKIVSQLTLIKNKIELSTENNSEIQLNHFKVNRLSNQNLILLFSVLILSMISILSFLDYKFNYDAYGDHVLQLCGTDAINGTYFITSNCLLDADFTNTRNILIQNTTVLTIPNNVTLTVIFGNTVTIEPGSGLLISLGGTLHLFP